VYYSSSLQMKVPFPGLESISRNYSQAFQDMFVLTALQGKREGFFLEIGASDPMFISNTYLLEKKFGWRGISVEINPRSVRRFARKRDSTIVGADALQIDYSSLLRDAGVPDRLDYLQVDIDPSIQSLRCLERIPLDEFRFSVITYETDFYDPTVPIEEKVAIRDQSRELLMDHGYSLVGAGIANTGPDDVFEDWWVDPEAVDPDVVSRLHVAGEFNDSGQRFLTKGPHLVATEFFEGQGLGNQLWAYAATRSIAEARGLDFSIVGHERFKGRAFIDLDFGIPAKAQGKSREGNKPRRLPEGLRFYKRESKLLSRESDTDVSRFDEALLRVPADTLIDGTFQSYRYISGREESIRHWIKVDSEVVALDDSTCVIHVRAGDFAGVQHAFLGPEYYANAISHVKNSEIRTRFVCVTDQPHVARELLPEHVEIVSTDETRDPYRASHHHGGPIEHDFGLMVSAKKLIISNSSFAWWAAFLNPNDPFVIAPKYWSNHMGESSEWSTAEIGTPRFHYLDRDGTLLTYTECANEIASSQPVDTLQAETGALEDMRPSHWRDRLRERLRSPYHLIARR